jgi:hypothetical protein
MIEAYVGWSILSRYLPILIIALVASACGSGDDDDDDNPSTCLETLDLACSPAYEPTYDAIFDNLLSKTCGAASTGSVCHYGPSPDDAQAGLALSDREDAYRNLLGTSGGRARVIPKDPECSILVQRIESNDPAFRMPVGRAPLTPAERCAVRQWIANGAVR